MKLPNMKMSSFCSGKIILFTQNTAGNKVIVPMSSSLILAGM